MEKQRIVVNVEAKIDWMFPPENEQEKIMREYANNYVRAAGKKSEQIVSLLVAVLLENEINFGKTKY
jgi:hypothetical protein